tara:strand:+ start:30 stop:404 length:375 start_codon:yes stop_codon:yes gene_type:complete
MSDDLDKIAKFEKAIKDKYGAEAIENPKKHWTDVKEQQYSKDKKKLYEKMYKKSKVDFEDRKEYKISKKYEKEYGTRNCPVCDSYLFSNLESAYITKYGCCKRCYIMYVEGREQRWNSGWRPEQ